MLTNQLNEGELRRGYHNSLCIRYRRELTPCGKNRGELAASALQRLKPGDFALLAARLKSCPDTRRKSLLKRPERHARFAKGLCDRGGDLWGAGGALWMQRVSACEATSDPSRATTFACCPMVRACWAASAGS